MSADESPSAASSQPVDRADWLDTLADLGAAAADDGGWLRPLGTRHHALFAEQGPQLLVTFDTVEACLARKGSTHPAQWDFAEGMGWSCLSLISDGPTWFRDDLVTQFFDDLVDDGFFDRFDTVVFCGSGTASHAAAAYAVTAPGATVVVSCPRATMTGHRVPFEMRDPATRRMDFTHRYGHAPDMVQGAGAVWLLADPGHAPDAMQRALFHGRHVHQLNLRRMGDRVDQALDDLDLWPRLLEAAMKDTLSEASFATLWRARRRYGSFLKSLLAQADRLGRDGLAHVICANVARRTRAPRFLRRLAEMDKARGPLTPAREAAETA